MSTARERDRECASEIFEFPTRVEYDDTGHRDDRETGARELGPHVSGLWFMMENVGRGLGRGSAVGAPRLHFEDSVEKARAMRGDVRVEAPASRHGRGWRVRVPQETRTIVLNLRIGGAPRTGRSGSGAAAHLLRCRAATRARCPVSVRRQGRGWMKKPRGFVATRVRGRRARNCVFLLSEGPRGAERAAWSVERGFFHVVKFGIFGMSDFRTILQRFIRPRQQLPRLWFSHG